jgi:hypothetical protein
MRLVAWLVVASCSSTPVAEPVSGSAEVRSVPTCGPANAANCFAHTARGEAQEHCSMTMDHCEREQAIGNLAPVTVPCRLVRRH